MLPPKHFPLVSVSAGWNVQCKYQLPRYTVSHKARPI